MGNEQSDLTETKCWKFIKWVPGVNILYGSARCFVYAIKENDREVLDSAIATIGGTIGIFVGGFACGLFSGAVSYAAEMIAAGIAQNIIIGGGDIYLMYKFEPNEFKKLSSDEIESLLYEKVLKDIPFVGAVYSLPRIAVYALKGNGEQRNKSFCSFVANSIGSTAGVLGAAGAQHFVPQAVNVFNVSLQDDFGRAVAYIAQEGGTKLGKCAGPVFKYGAKELTENLLKNVDKTKYL